MKYPNQILQKKSTEFFFLAFCLLFWFITNADGDPLSGSLQQGNYGVGFRIIQTYDYSRVYKGKQGRPMQIAVWYPANVKTPKMKFSEYLELYLTEESFAKPTEKQVQENLSMWKKELAGRVEPAADGERILQAETFGVKNAPVANGSFPVIIYGAGGQGESFENSCLFEYLASHGYFVLASPAVGPFEHKTTVDAVGLEAEARDMEFLIAQAQQFTEADLTRLGVTGWSWGGLSAMLVQMRNPNVDAVLSLDGSIAMHEDKIQTTAFFSPQRVRVPVMFMSTRRNVPRVESFIKKVNYADIFLLSFNEITHSDFSDYGFIARNFAASLNDSDAKKKQIYELINRYALQFFNAFLKGEASGKEFLAQSSPQNDLLAITRKTTLPLPPTQEEFFEMIREKGFEPAYQIYQEVKKRDADYQIFEPFEITVLADRLFKAGREEDAIKAAKLRVEAYPDDYLSYEWVANLYFKQKDWKNALQYYGTAYGMALKVRETPELLEELDWYRKRIETVKSNFSIQNTEVKTN